MYTKTIFGSALVALFSVPSVQAGSATVQNNCGFPIYLWSVANVYNVEMNTIEAGDTKGYSEEFRPNPDGGGICIKVGQQPKLEHITQFEYTLGGDLVFYDLSNIDGAPFQSSGMTLAPTVSSCPTVQCPAGVVCTEAYINPDDVATKGCSVDTDLVLTLCPGGSGSTSSDSSSAPASSATQESTSSAAPPATTLSTSVTSSAAATESAQVKYRPVAQRDNSSRRRHVHGHIHERH